MLSGLGCSRRELGPQPPHKKSAVAAHVPRTLVLCGVETGCHWSLLAASLAPDSATDLVSRQSGGVWYSRTPDVDPLASTGVFMYAGAHPPYVQSVLHSALMRPGSKA